MITKLNTFFTIATIIPVIIWCYHNTGKLGAIIGGTFVVIWAICAAYVFHHRNTQPIKNRMNIPANTPTIAIKKPLKHTTHQTTQDC